MYLLYLYCMDGKSAINLRLVKCFRQIVKLHMSAHNIWLLIIFACVNTSCLARKKPSFLPFPDLQRRIDQLANHYWALWWTVHDKALRLLDVRIALYRGTVVWKLWTRVPVWAWGLTKQFARAKTWLPPSRPFRFLVAIVLCLAFGMFLYFLFFNACMFYSLPLSLFCFYNRFKILPV